MVGNVSVGALLTVLALLLSACGSGTNPAVGTVNTPTTVARSATDSALSFRAVLGEDALQRFDRGERCPGFERGLVV